ncbi:Peptide transporter PTR2A [Rhizoctonia solani]|uniref:Peptide transporter PTR2A n=1 Tax=Rhizoctonia solani TaxID=456999 RepID=A0A8H7IEA4_9AGAM|nr:Peptide transporter PTR2A [Rhizoctonia solani]
MDRGQLNVSPNEKEKSLDSPVMQTVEEHIDFDEDIVLPTEEEKLEFAERFSYYGTTGPFVNYIQRPLPEGGNGAGAPPKGTEIRPGALGKGQQASTGLTTFFSFLSYLTPIIGAILSDAYWGKLKTLFIFAIVGGVGHVILVGTAAPTLLQNNPTGSYVGLIISLIIMGFATGAIKSNVSPLVAEQIPNSREHIRVMKNGERVIVDPNLTIQRVFMYFYLPTIVYVLVPIVLWVGRHKYVQYPPADLSTSRLFGSFAGMRDPSKWDRARPVHTAQAHGNSNATGGFVPTWDDTFVDEMRRTMHAVKIFVFYPLFWVPYNQMTNNIVSQAGVMTTHGVPNDLLQNINAIAIIILIPLMDRIVYPGLRRVGCIVRPIQRITLGFMFAAMAMVYASALQNGIYKNKSLCFASITGLEYAYNKAPLRMKSIVMAAFLLTQGVGNALSWALLPVSTDPYLVWNYAGSGIAAFIAGVAFWICFRHMDATEEEQNEIGRQAPGVAE